MSISSSLAHKYDEFDEFPQRSAPKSAYEELKEWCKKHLESEQFTIIPETESFLTTIYFNSRNDMGIADYICFDKDGDYCGAGAVPYEAKIEHFDEYENGDEYH